MPATLNRRAGGCHVRFGAQCRLQFGCLVSPDLRAPPPTHFSASHRSISSSESSDSIALSFGVFGLRELCYRRLVDAEQAKATILRFNDFINARDIEHLSQMMTDDHVFIDAADNRVSGKSACARAWQGFFAEFPDYRNEFVEISANEELLVVVGRSSCSDPRLDGPALWMVRVRGNWVSEWRVIEDTVFNRNKLGLAS